MQDKLKISNITNKMTELCDEIYENKEISATIATLVLTKKKEIDDPNVDHFVMLSNVDKVNNFVDEVKEIMEQYERWTGYTVKHYPVYGTDQSNDNNKYTLHILAYDDDDDEEEELKTCYIWLPENTITGSTDDNEDESYCWNGHTCGVSINNLIYDTWYPDGLING